MKSLFFFASLFSLVLVVNLNGQGLLRRPPAPSSCQGPNCPLLLVDNGSVQSEESKLEMPHALVPPSQDVVTPQFTLQPDIVSERTPGKSPSKPGTTPEMLGSGKVTIDLPSLATSPQLKSLVDKSGSLLDLLWWLIATMLGLNVGRSGVQVGSGLLSAIRALFVNQAIRSGQLVQSVPVNQVVPSSPMTASSSVSPTGQG